MKVYVLETGSYDTAMIRGVYSSPEKAMTAWQPARSERPSRASHERLHTYTWGSRTEYGWEFDGDWDDVATVCEFELDEEPNGS